MSVDVFADWMSARFYRKHMSVLMAGTYDEKMLGLNLICTFVVLCVNV